MLWRMPAGLSPERIGIMFARLDDLPAVPAFDGATSQHRTAVDSGRIYGTQEFPVAGGRARATLFRAHAEPDRKAVAETAETAGTSATPVRSIDRSQDLPWIHDVVRIERLLDGAHQRHRFAVFLVQELDLAHADAVLAGAGAAHRQGARHHAVVERLGARQVGRIVRIDHHGEMEVAVADMADDGGIEAVGYDVLLRLQDAFGEPRDRHAHVGRPHAPAGPRGLGRPSRIVARLPHLAALLGLAGPGEVAAAMFGGDRLHHLGLLLGAGL